MSKQRITTVSLLVALVLVAGCTNLSDVLKAKDAGEGTGEIYPINTDQAWKIAVTVFRWEGADAIEEHRDEGYMLTSAGMNLMTWGTSMGAWVERIDEDHTKVVVITKRRFAVDFTVLTETTFHRRFAQAVEIVKAGKPLPSSPPVEEAEESAQ